MEKIAREDELRKSAPTLRQEIAAIETFDFGGKSSLKASNFSDNEDSRPIS